VEFPSSVLHPKVRQMCVTYAPKVRQICTKYAPNVRQICTKSAPNMRQMCVKCASASFIKWTKGLGPGYSTHNGSWSTKMTLRNGLTKMSFYKWDMALRKVTFINFMALDIICLVDQGRLHTYNILGSRKRANPRFAPSKPRPLKAEHFKRNTWCRKVWSSRSRIWGQLLNSLLGVNIGP
jgi:hypothetical protein